MEIKQLLCKIGIHKNKVIGTAVNPFIAHTIIVAFGCERCGKKSSKGEIWNAEDIRLMIE
jgi:hypothetical protein